MSEYTTKDSGERQDFESGARRDISTGKTRPDLIPEKARLRWGDLMARGAEKYGPNNWRLGMPLTRFLESAHRHLLNYELGDRSEDHLAAVLFNIGAMIHFEGTEWDDINGETIVDDQLHEWIIQAYLAEETIPSVTPKQAQDSFWAKVKAGDLAVQFELQPADESEDLINWDKVAEDAEKDWSQGPGSPWNKS